MDATQNRADLYARVSVPLLSFIWTRRNTLAVDQLTNAFNELAHSPLKLDRIFGQDSPQRPASLTLVFSVGPGRKPAGMLTYYPTDQKVVYSIDGSIVLPSGMEHARGAWLNALVDLAALAEVQVNQKVTL